MSQWHPQWFEKRYRCSPWKFHSALHVGIIWKTRIGKIKEIFSNGVVNLSRMPSWTRTTVWMVRLKGSCTADVENCWGYPVLRRFAWIYLLFNFLSGGVVGEINDIFYFLPHIFENRCNEKNDKPSIRLLQS